MSAGEGGEPYEDLVAHAELELELAGRGEVDAVAALAPRWRELEAALGPSPPPAAAEMLSRAVLIHERTHIELLRARDAVLREVAGVRTARAAARGYGRPSGAGRGVERRA